MPVGEVFKRKKEILEQNRSIGIPTVQELQNSENVVYVHEYMRDDGTTVKAHWRSKRKGDLLPTDMPDYRTEWPQNNHGVMNFNGGEVLADISKSIVDFIQKIGIETLKEVALSAKDIIVEAASKIPVDRLKTLFIQSMTYLKNIAESLKNGVTTGGASEIGKELKEISDIVLEGGVEFNDFIDVVEKSLKLPAKTTTELLEAVKDGLGRIVKTGIIVGGKILEKQNSEIDLSIKPAEISSPSVSNIKLKSHVELNFPKSKFVNINNKLNTNYKDAMQCMNIALIEPENIENNSDFKILTDKELGTMSNKMHFDIPDNVKTVQYSSNSSLAKSVQESKSFQDAVRVWVSTSPEQRPNKILLELNDNENLARSILHATIFQPRIENGYFKGYLYDLYDFKLQWLESGFKTFVNTSAVLLQEIKKLKNYNIIIPIEYKL